MPCRLLIWNCPTGQDRSRLTASQLLSQAVIVFGNHDWEVKHVTSEMAHFEKKQGVKPALAFIIIIALGLLGSLFIILDIMSRRKEVVTLQIYPDGTLMGTSTQRGQYRYENLEQLRDLAICQNRNYCCRRRFLLLVC